MDQDLAKKKAGEAAAKFIEKGMVVGLGTGSTAHYFIQALAKRDKEESLGIHTVSSSKDSLILAKKLGLMALDMDTVSSIDITVDGADEIDPKKQMIKGGGGALLREKILASMSHEMVVIVDETKQVKHLGKRKLPVEVVPFGAFALLQTIQKNYSAASFRTEGKERFVTDNGNYIIDISLPFPVEDPKKIDTALKEIPGVIETGFFCHLAGRVLVAFFDGQVVTLP